MMDDIAKPLPKKKVSKPISLAQKTSNPVKLASAATNAPVNLS